MQTRPSAVVSEERNISPEINCCNVKAPRTRLIPSERQVTMLLLFRCGPAAPIVTILRV